MFEVTPYPVLLLVVTLGLELEPVHLLIDITYLLEKLRRKIMLPVVLPFEEDDAVVQDLEYGKIRLILRALVIIGAVYALLNESAELIRIYLYAGRAFTVRACLIRDETVLTDKSMEPVTLGVKTVAAAVITHIRHP